jgi:pimeloyl-ACP methyl ester carboxylesterase
MTWTAQEARVQGRNAVYLEAGGSGAPNVILLLHAFPIGMRLWESQVVPDGWRAIAPALPGFDGTDAPSADSTAIDDYARAALDLLDMLHVRSFVVCGVSMGGYAAFGVWRAAASRCRGLVLADSRAGADTEQGRAARNALLELVRTRGAAAVADDMLPKLLGETTRAHRPGVASRARTLIESQTSQGIAAAVVRMRDRPDSTPLLSQIHIPVLVVVGGEDTLTPPAESEKMRDALPNAQIEVIPRAGHLACMEDPPAFNAILSRYLSSVG